MKNNVYVRSNKSIKSISLTRLLFLLPLIIYGFYKNGIYLYIHKYATVLGLFKPLVFIGIGGLIGIIVNILYEKIIMKNKESLLDIIFSSFHMEYGVLLGCIVSINTSIWIFTAVTFVLLFISKFIKNRVNVMCLTFLVIYLISILVGSYDFSNAYEVSKTFNLNILDYLIGRGPGGIAGSHIILLALSLIGLFITNNNKTNISVCSIVTLFILFSIYSIVKHVSISELMFTNNNIFLLIYVVTDYVTSSYTINGMNYFGIFVGVLAFAFYFINPIVGTPLAILVVSLFNNLIDRKIGKLKRRLNF